MNWREEYTRATGEDWASGLGFFTRDYTQWLEEKLSTAKTNLGERSEPPTAMLAADRIDAASDSMSTLQLEIGDWQDATFTEATALSKMSHLAKEVIELNKALRNGDEIEIAEELADCQHLLFGIASKCGMNLHAATIEKFDVNKGRNWGKPDENGVVEHL